MTHWLATALAPIQLHSWWFSPACSASRALFFPPQQPFWQKTVGLTQVFPVILIKVLLPSGHEESPVWSWACCFTGKWAKTQCFTIYFQWEPLSSWGCCRWNSSQAQLSGHHRCPSHLSAIRQRGKHSKFITEHHTMGPVMLIMRDPSATPPSGRFWCSLWSGVIRKVKSPSAVLVY